MFSPLRSTFYGFTLTFAIISTILGLLAAFIDDPVVVRTRVFGLCLGIFSFFAWLWISVLTAYHDHPLNHEDVLSRSSCHIPSFAVMIFPWIAFSIGLLTNVSSKCSREDDSFKCGITISAAVFGLLAAIFAAGTVYAIRNRPYSDIKPAKVSGPAANGPYAAYTPLRTALYALTLTTTISASILGAAAAGLDTFAPHLRTFGICLTIVSFPAWIWISILTSYHMRPDADQLLTRASTHFYTFVAMIPPFLAFGVGTLTQQSYNCQTDRSSDGLAGGWCGESVVTGAVSILVALLAAATAFSIHLSGSSVSPPAAAGAGSAGYLRRGLDIINGVLTGLQRNVCLRSTETKIEPSTPAVDA